MTKDKQIDGFVNAYLDFIESLRRVEPLSGEDARKFLVLFNVRQYEKEYGKPLTISDISRISGMALPNVSRFLRPLEENGCIARKREGRTVYLTITEKGDAMLLERFTNMRSVIGEMLDGLTDEEILQYLSISEKICSRLHNIIECKKQ